MKRCVERCVSMCLSLVLIVCMLPLSVLAVGSVRSYDDFMDKLEQLEAYAAEYAAQSYRDPGELVLNFIRTGVDRYNDDNWVTLAGQEIVGFTSYVEMMDAETGSEVMNLRDIVTKDFKLPNGDQVDFGHMFGTMNISYLTSGSADLSGWAGDLCDLLDYTVRLGNVPSGTVEQMADYIRENCFGVDADDAFGWDDFYGDMDAFYLVTEYKKGGRSWSQIMDAYFTGNLSDVNRAVYFVNNRFGVEDSKVAVRKAIYDSYSADVGIKLLESKRGLTSYNTLREACCYALADYLYSLAAGQLVAGSGSGSTVENGYYSVFSSNETILAPGITQKINYAQTVDGKQIVYYVATVDVTRDDVTIMANYKDNDPSKGWGYQRVEDQANALMNNYKDKYENFNVVVATNADGYNMATGEPGGLLVMNGVEWHPVDGDGFFAILKDGSAMIGTKADYDTHKSKIQEAVGGFGAVLVKDGKINVTKTPNYTSSRASRTAVGIKADGSVVMMVLDGRQQPFSAGGAMEEIAQIMLEAGCVHAINLDGGGSTTYLSKPAGSDKLQLTNRPSDGYARSVSTSLVAISTAKSSNEFDHAILSSGYDYITAGTSMKISATGVSNTGNNATIPVGAYWTVSDNSVGSISADGMFTAEANGTVTVQLMVGEKCVGSKVLQVVTPDNIKFAEERITAIYGVPTELALTLWYNGYPVAFNTDTDVFVVLEKSEAGIIDNITFTGSESSGIRTVMVGAMLLADQDLIAYATINMYKADEALFDFDNATAGNRTLAWHREVLNAHTTDNLLYRVSDPNSPIEIKYTFALDMTTIEMPAQLEPLKSMLPGADAGSTAWSFLLQLAERVCELTTVTIRAQFSPDLELDISDLKISNDYFVLTSATVDENNVLTIICNWVDQTAPIDAATANPLCILSGVKATVKDDANYSNNEILISNNGSVSYDVYLAASSLHAFASNPGNNAGSLYGLYPYVHDPACRTDGNDAGAHFSSQYAEFADIYVINSEIRQGWIENSYYVDNVAVTGVQYIPSREDKYQKYFYEFDKNGVLVKALSGMIEYEGGLYHAVNGKPTLRWHSDNDENGNEIYYYFDPKTGKAVDGVQQINEGTIFTYIFKDCILVKGDLRQHTCTKKDCVDHTGLGYRWAGRWVQGQWVEVDGKSYYFQKYHTVADQGFLYKAADSQDVPYNGYYLFDENSVFQKDFTGIYNDYYVENGIAYGYTRRVVDIDGYYYLVNNDLKILKNGTYSVSAPQTNGLVSVGTYEFDEYGRMTTSLVTVSENFDVDYTVMGRLLTIDHDAACKVGYLVGNEYVAIDARRNEDGTYSFAVPGNVDNVLIVRAGDMDGDGKFDATDKEILEKALLSEDHADYAALTAEQRLAADLNGNGEVNSADKVLLSRALLAEDHRMYSALEW